MIFFISLLAFFFFFLLTGNQENEVAEIAHFSIEEGLEEEEAFNPNQEYVPWYFPYPTTCSFYFLLMHVIFHKNACILIFTNCS